jgi:hypothetical protein
MLDVHPPHQAAHTWKDFFIHIATICIGLLIAIGLEQTVEAIHHTHQRHELLDQLEAEHRQTLKDAEDSITYDAILLNWYSARIDALDSVLLQHRPIPRRVTPS